MVTAYWICNRHPLGSNSAVDAAGLTWQRVEAYGDTTGRRNVLHIMSRERIGQRRGVPLLAPVLESLKQLGRPLLRRRHLFQIFIAGPGSSQRMISVPHGK